MNRREGITWKKWMLIDEHDTKFMCMRAKPWHWFGLTFFIFDFRCQIVSDVTVVLDLIFYHQRDIGRHRQLHLCGQWRCFCEWIQVAACECQRDWLLHFNDDRFFFLVDGWCLGKFHIGCTNITASREFYTLKWKWRSTKNICIRNGRLLNFVIPCNR